MEARHVVVLGAGFSRAISTAMPLTDELGRRAVGLLAKEGRRLNASHLTFGPELSFESWLSLLSEEQPQLRTGITRHYLLTYAMPSAVFCWTRNARRSCSRPPLGCTTWSVCCIAGAQP